MEPCNLFITVVILYGCFESSWGFALGSAGKPVMRPAAPLITKEMRGILRHERGSAAAHNQAELSHAQERDHKLRREAFLAAAYRTIEKKGLEGMTVRAVAREAGFTTGALVHYVSSMDKLLVESSEYAARYVRGDMEAMEALPDKLELLRQVVYLSLPLDEERRGNWNFWMGFWSVRCAMRPCASSPTPAIRNGSNAWSADRDGAGIRRSSRRYRPEARGQDVCRAGRRHRHADDAFGFPALRRRSAKNGGRLDRLVARPTRPLSTVRIERPRRPRSNGAHPHEAELAKAV